MKLYLLERGDRVDYDEYDSMVVAAENEHDALRTLPPRGLFGWTRELERIKITHIGNAVEDLPIGVVLASFNAG
jgi:hypothetical protein